MLRKDVFQHIPFPNNAGVIYVSDVKGILNEAFFPLELNPDVWFCSIRALCSTEKSVRFIYNSFLSTHPTSDDETSPLK